MVRGASLELMDHTFDGIEDSQSGDLRGGLGQVSISRISVSAEKIFATFYF
jgi:hypothetical protein